MYWRKQEQFIFDVILFVVLLFQAFTFFILKTEELSLQKNVFLVMFNFLLLFAMILYAKWLWKTASYKKAFVQVAKHEIVLLLIVVAGILFGMFMRKLGYNT